MNDYTDFGSEGEGPTVEPQLFDDTLRFLRSMPNNGRCVVSAICPDTHSIETRTITLDQPKKLRAFLERWNGERNLYFVPNTVRKNANPNKKPKEADIEDMVVAFVDIDPSEEVDPADEEAWQAERARILRTLEDFEPEPTAILDSGNGYQAFWVLDEPYFVGGDKEGIRQGKGHNVALAEKLGGDDCESVDHLYRLPGTNNVPSTKKRERGRKERRASVVRWPSKDRECGLGNLDWLDPGEKCGQAELEQIELGAIELFASLDDLPAGISARIRKVIELGPAADPRKYPSRNEAVMAVCCAGVRAGWTNEEIAAVILDPKWQISERLRQRGGKRDAALEIAKARSLVGKVRPQIVYDEDRLAGMMEEIDAALREGDIPIYQMDGRLVRAVRLGKECDDEGVNRKAGAVVIRDVGVYFLKERMREAAKFVVAKQKDGAVAFETMKKLPLEFARHFADRPGEWNLPMLAGICEAPTLRDDGTVVSEQGYDPQSGLIIDTQGVDFPTVPDQPSKADATAALDTLIDVIAEFPFEPDEAGAPLGLGSPSASRSVALSMILTAVIRRSLRTAPLHGISAPTMATGKSLLADVAAMIATGRLAPVMSYASNEDENEKRLLASLRQGDPLLAIDNIEDPVRGASLCSILTAEVWKSRILGVSLNATVSTKTLMIANGNNLSFRGDIATRVIVSLMDARCDDPGERPAFRYDLKQHIPRERPRLVAAALTVLRAYIVAGYPLKDEVKPLSRFEDWSRLVRDALIWLGQSDPVATRKKVAATDTEGAALAGLLAEWQNNFRVGEWKLPNEVIAAADDQDGSERRPMPLGIALGAFCASRNGVTPIGLGRRLSKYANRRIGGRWIEADIDPAGKVANQYRLMTVELERDAQRQTAQGDMLGGE